MARGLLIALNNMVFNTDGPTTSGFAFQHRLSHDFESLIWVVVYAMMIHHRSTLAPEKCELYKRVLDQCWAAHAYSNLLISHNHMMTTGCSADSLAMVYMWFPDLREATFFRDAMRLIRDQGDGDHITYERICKLFKDHINPAKEPQAADVVSK